MLQPVKVIERHKGRASSSPSNYEYHIQYSSAWCRILIHNVQAVRALAMRWASKMCLAAVYDLVRVRWVQQSHRLFSPPLKFLIQIQPSKYMAGAK
jgi:hypothetical protein